MRKVVIDFESYYDCDISVKKLGNYNYTHATDAYCVGLVDCESGECACGTIEEMSPAMENIARDTHVQVVAANSNFDQAWFEQYWGATYNAWHCILDHAAYCQYPRNLADLAKVVLGEAVDKTIRDEMEGKHFANLPDTEKEKVLSYCLTDCQKEVEILAKLPPMPDMEARIAEHTRMTCRRGIMVDTELTAKDRTRLELMRFDAFKKIPWHADAKPLSYTALTKWCSKRDIPVPKSTAKTDEECTDLMSSNVELNALLSQMRRFRRANTLLKKVSALQDRLRPDGVLPLELLYCGAPHTRRWSSRGVNIQNLDKEPIDTGLGDEIWSRRWLIPRPGCVFLIFDFSQIEPRCLNWLVGNDDMMEALRNGYSYYEAYIRSIGAEKRIKWSGTPGTLKKEIPLKNYTLIKNESLGCGYGMGADKFKSYVFVNGGTVISDVDAKATIDLFRLKNPKIVSFWRKLDNLIKTAAHNKDRHLSVEMPTGDTLQYFLVRTNKGGYQGYVTKGDLGPQSHQPRLWGGTLTENVTQRMARDIIAEAVLRLEASGLSVLFHSHDESILEVPIEHKDEALIKAEKILTYTPEWCEGLPLAVEGDFAETYTK